MAAASSALTRSTVTPGGTRMSHCARARSGMVLTPMPPSMHPVLTVMRRRVSASPSPDSASDTAFACAMVRSTATGIENARSSSERTAPSASSSASTAFLPRWTCAAWFATPVASSSTHTLPFSPMRTTRGEPVSALSIASPTASSTLASTYCVPHRPPVSSSPTRVSTNSPFQASRNSARVTNASTSAATPAFMSLAPRP